MRDETEMELLPLILHRAGDLAFLAAQHRASGNFVSLPFAVQPDGYSVDIGNDRRPVLGSRRMLDRAAVLSAGGHDLYLTIARYSEPYYLGDSGQVLGYRVTSNVRDLAALFVEIDVGTKRDGTPHAYRTHDEAVAALDLATEKIELPPPSTIINSGSGGAHAVWALDRALPPDEWLDLARRFKAALESAGLVADWQQTTMQICAPRLPGTFNWKTGEARLATITRLGGTIGDLGSFRRSTDTLCGIVASYAPDITPLPDDMAGIADLTNCAVRLTVPVLPADVAALLAIFPNTGIDYDSWIKIAFACWAVVHQSADLDAERIVHDAFITWSLAYPDARRGDRGWIDPEKTWKSTRKVRSIGDATFVILARQLGFQLPSRVTSAASVFGEVRLPTGAGTAVVPASEVLLKRIRAHHRIALGRGRLEAERVIYRLLLAEPPDNVRPLLGQIINFMLEHHAGMDALTAFVDRLAPGEGVAKVSAAQNYRNALDSLAVAQLRLKPNPDQQAPSSPDAGRKPHRAQENLSNV
jgi:hypothetical protein